MPEGRLPNGRFGPGNTYGTGQNQYSPRARGGTLSVSFDSARMEAMARRVAGMAARADKPILAANRLMARELQNLIAFALTSSVQERGRAQRSKPQSDRLAGAIMSERNRRVNVSGFTVGYLDTIAAVRPYWRGLELGTYRHRGRFVPGVFVAGSAGMPQPLVMGGKDLVQIVRTTAGQNLGAAAEALGGEPGRGKRFGVRPGFRIKNPIIGYHYIDRGTRDFVSRGWTSHEARATYAAALRHAGLGELADTLGGVRLARHSRGLSGAPIGAEA